MTYCGNAQAAEIDRHNQVKLQLQHMRDEAIATENKELKDCEKLNPNAQEVIDCTKTAQEKFRLADIEIQKKESDELTTNQNNLLRINVQCKPVETCSDCTSCETAATSQRHDRDLLQAQIEKNEFIGDERKAELDCSKMNPNSPQVMQCDQAASEAERLRMMDNDKRVIDINKSYQQDLSSIAAKCASLNPSNHPSQWTDSYGEMHSWDNRYVYTDKNGRQWAFPLSTNRIDFYDQNGFEYVLSTDPSSFGTDKLGNPFATYYRESDHFQMRRYGTQLP